MPEDSRGHLPKDEKWKFDESVTECFEDMLRRSIPQYDVMRQAVFSLGERYIRERTWIVDLGCSRGSALAPFVENRCVPGVRFYGCEVSPPMLAASRFRFEDEIKNLTVEIEELDLRTSYPYHAASVTLAVLCLQFVPIEYRQKIVRSAYQHTVPGGAMIVVEKVLGESHELDEAMVATYLNSKSEVGYSKEEIERKRLSLEGVLVPVTAKWNEALLRRGGFEHVDCFWRWMNFAGWVAVREE